MSDMDPSVGNRIFYISHMLMIAARTVGGPVNPGMIVEMERDLTKVTEDLDRALNVEYLQRIKETGKRSFPAMVDSQEVFVQS